MPTVGLPTPLLRKINRHSLTRTASGAFAPAIDTVTATVAAPAPARGRLLLLFLLLRLRSRLRLRFQLRRRRSPCRGPRVTTRLLSASLLRGKVFGLFISRRTTSSGSSGSAVSLNRMVGARGSANASRQSRMVSDTPLPRSQLRPRATRMALHVVPWAPDLPGPTTMARRLLGQSRACTAQQAVPQNTPQQQQQSSRVERKGRSARQYNVGEGAHPSVSETHTTIVVYTVLGARRAWVTMEGIS